jgi:hypothetical protein
MMFGRRTADDEQIVAEAMRELAGRSSVKRALPDPSFIWWKAQLLRRFEAEREAVAPIEISDRVHIGAALLGAGALAVGAWDHMPAIIFSPAAGLALAAGAVVVLSVIAVAALEMIRER